MADQAEFSNAETVAYEFMSQVRSHWLISVSWTKYISWLDTDAVLQIKRASNSTELGRLIVWLWKMGWCPQLWTLLDLSWDRELCLENLLYRECTVLCLAGIRSLWRWDQWFQGSVSSHYTDYQHIWADELFRWGEPRAITHPVRSGCIKAPQETRSM